MSLSKERNSLVRTASYASVAVAFFLLLTKGIVWWITDSVSLFASLIDSLLDMGASFINMIAVRHAMEPPDNDHRFGHGKAEALSALAQGVLISVSSIWLWYEVIYRFNHPQTLHKASLGIVVMLISILLSALLIMFQANVIKKTGSTAIKADAAHYRTDLIINGGVIASLLIVQNTGLTWVDTVFGGGIALYIFYTAWAIFKDSIKILMDQEVDPHIREKIQDIAMSHKDVRGVHDIRTRSSSTHLHVQIHLEMDGKITLEKAHEISDTVESEIVHAFPNSDVLIHQDPIGVKEKRDVF